MIGGAYSRFCSIQLEQHLPNVLMKMGPIQDDAFRIAVKLVDHLSEVSAALQAEKLVGSVLKSLEKQSTTTKIMCVLDVQVN